MTEKILSWAINGNTKKNKRLGLVLRVFCSDLRPHKANPVYVAYTVKPLES